MFNLFSGLFANAEVNNTLGIILHTSFIWLPIFLIVTLLDLRLIYKREEFIAKTETILLEIKLPREIFKSPLAMEIFFNGLFQTGGEGDWVEKYWKGQTRATFSLELASIDGAIHFFLWTRKGFKNAIEANLYSQFPGIEVYKVPDYTLPVSFDPEKTGMRAKEFVLTKADSYPIKTYVDYGMDKNPKEEFRIDPMTPLIEFMGSLGKEHQAWIQIVIRAHKAENKDPKTGKKIDKKWVEGAKEEINIILEKTKGEKDKEGKAGPSRRLTKGEEEVITALDRSISKFGFDVGIRAIYTAPKDVFAPSNMGGIISCFKNYNSNNLNGFRDLSFPSGEYHYFPFIKRSPEKINSEIKGLLTAYKKREYFYTESKRSIFRLNSILTLGDFVNRTFVLNTEELATIYHFPAGGLETSPSLSRIGSKKSEAPSNLPV